MSELYLKILLEEKVEKYNPSDTVDIYKTFSKLSTLNLAYYYYEFQDENILKYLQIKDIKPELTGSDLIKADYKQGILIGQILDELLKQKLNTPYLYPNKKAELAWVLKNFHKN